jgi:hypothetical protein
MPFTIDSSPFIAWIMYFRKPSFIEDPRVFMSGLQQNKETSFEDQIYPGAQVCLAGIGTDRA